MIDGQIAFWVDSTSARGAGTSAIIVPSTRRANTDEIPYAPFHDVQTYHVSALARAARSIFQEQWSIVLVWVRTRASGAVEKTGAVPAKHAADRFAAGGAQPDPGQAVGIWQ